MGIKLDETSYVQIFSDFLSLITIGSCLVLKVPQILSIIEVKNAKGMNLTGLLMELSSYTITLCYNYRNGYAVLSYLEYPIILVQEVVLIYVVIYYKGLLSGKAYMYAMIYFAIFVAFVIGIFPRELLAILIPFCTPVGASSKVIQLMEIIRTKNAESVSLLTWALSVFTNLTRIFTIYVDSADTLLLLNFIVSSGLSSSILVATYYYQRKTKTE